MSITLDSVSPDAVDAYGGKKLIIEGDFSEHVGQDFEVVCTPRLPGESVLALTGKPGSPRVIQPLNAGRMVCYTPRLIASVLKSLEDPLDSDLGYWRLDTSYPSAINFSGGIATVQGAAYAEISGWSAMKNYAVIVDARHTSPAVGDDGWFGPGILARGNYFAADAHGYAALINTLDSNAYAVKAINGVFSINTYPVTPTLAHNTWYRLDYRARSLGGTTVELEFRVDGNLIFSEQHSDGALSGAAALGVSATGAQTADFDDMLITSLTDVGAGEIEQVIAYDLTVRLIEDPNVSATIEEAFNALPRQYNTSVFGLRSSLPPTYNTGPRNPGLLEQIT